MSLDDAIERLRCSLRVARLPTFRAANDQRALRSIEAEIAPLHLPEDVRRYWELIDVDSLPFVVSPRLSAPSMALGTWTIGRDDAPEVVPRPLFDVARDGWSALSVELGGPGWEGGSIFEWGHGGESFQLRYRNIIDFVSTLADVLEQERYSMHNDVAVLDPLATEAVADQRLGEGPAPAGHSRRAVFGSTIEDWPDHWVTASGFEL